MTIKTKRGLLLGGIIVGAILTAGPIVGFVLSIVGQVLAFKHVGEGTALSNPTVLAHDIGLVLVSTAVGIVLFPIGLVLLILSVKWWSKLKQQTPPPLTPPVR